MMVVRRATLHPLRPRRASPRPRGRTTRYTAENRPFRRRTQYRNCGPPKAMGSERCSRSWAHVDLRSCCGPRSSVAPAHRPSQLFDNERDKPLGPLTWYQRLLVLPPRIETLRRGARPNRTGVSEEQGSPPIRRVLPMSMCFRGGGHDWRSCARGAAACIVSSAVVSPCLHRSTRPDLSPSCPEHEGLGSSSSPAATSTPTTGPRGTEERRRPHRPGSSALGLRQASHFWNGSGRQGIGTGIAAAQGPGDIGNDLFM